MDDTQAFRDEDRDFSLGCSHDSEMHKLKYNLRKKFNCLCEGTVKQGSPTPLNEIYTELYITESESGEISKEYEMFETEPRKEATEDTLIKHNDIFRTLPEQDKPIRTVLTRGVAGIGKTVSVQKFILDWAEGKANQEVHLIFPLPFRELNLMKDQKLSLSDLLVFFIKTKEIGLSSNRHKILFIFDGLDECRISLDFQSSVRLCDVTKSSSVDVLLINLIKGNLLPSALIWITSRPAAADLIPSECVDRVTEVRGFSGQQKEDYFRKRISDQSLANRIITHLKSSRSLYIMCHIPVFCWISATVLERTMSEAESQEIPKTLTQMYTHFLIIQTNIKREKDYEKTVKDEDMIVKLGKLAFLKFMKGNLMFYEEDLIECGIDVREASVYSGLCTQIFREEFGMIQRKVYCFVHLSIQEHLAAVYVHLCFTNNNINAFDQITKQTNHTRKTLVSIFDLHQRAVDEALESKNGYLDIFLCFLLGLSVESNQTLLQELMTETRSSSHSNEEIVKYIKQKIRENPSPEKSINLFYCLNELGDHSLLRVMEQFLKSEKKNEAILSFSQWSAVVSALLNKMIEKQNDDVCLKPQPYVKARSSVKVSVSSKVHTALKKLRSNFAKQRELNLSGNKLGYPEVHLLSVELTNPDCKLDTLRLRNCGITDKVLAVLTSALRLNPSHLRELYLSDNHLGDEGVMRLSAELGNKHCKMEILWLCNCGITDKGCSALASALRTNPSHLRELNMSGNNLGDSGVNLLSAELQNPHCNLETLRLCHCGITGEGCAALALALISRPSHLTELNLTGNKLGDSGIMRLSSGLKNPRCKLEILRLCNCDVTDEGCSALASALGSNPSHFKVLDLLGNKLSDTGLQPLVALKKLRSLSF